MGPPWAVDVPPLWPAMLAASLWRQGYRGTCFDLNLFIHNRLAPEQRYLWEMRYLFRWERQRHFDAVWGLLAPLALEALEQILLQRPRVVAFSTTQASFLFSLRLAATIKEVAPEIRVVIGGPSVFWTQRVDQADVPTVVIDDETGRVLDQIDAVDVLIRGEADHTLPQMMHHLLEGLDPLAVPGAVARIGGVWYSPTPPLPPAELDGLPFPDYTDLPPVEHEPGVAFISSRGCTRRCTFCNDCSMQGVFRRRSAVHMVGEIIALRRAYGVRWLQMVDLLINGDLQELEHFCDLLIHAGIEVEWAGQGIIDPRMDLRLMTKMVRAGCQEITYGLESLSQPVVDLMNKGFSVRDAIRFFRDARRAGLRTSINLVAGFPGETPEMFEETVATLEHECDNFHRVQAINACVLTPYSRLSKGLADFGVDSSMQEGFLKWRGPVGNDYSERKRRVRALQELVTRIGIDCQEQNLYDEGEPPPDGEHQPLEPGQALQIDEVELTDAAGRPCHRLAPGEALRVVLRYTVFRPISEPLFRAQLFIDRYREWESALIFGTNTERVGVSVGDLKPGRGEVMLELERVDLLQGVVRVSVGVWPSELASVPYDQVEGLEAFEMAGTCTGQGVCRQPARWTEPTLSEGEATADRIHSLELLDPGSAPIEQIVAGTSVTLRLCCEVAAADELRLMVKVLLGKRTVFRTESTELPAGDSTMELRWDSFDLLENGYTLEAALVQRQSGEVRCSQQRDLEVRSRREQGAGVVLIPCSWVVPACR